MQSSGMTREQEREVVRDAHAAIDSQFSSMSKEQSEKHLRRLDEHRALLMRKAELEDSKLGIEANLILQTERAELRALQAAERTFQAASGSHQALTARKLQLEAETAALSAKIEEFKAMQAAIANGTMTKEQSANRYHALRNALVATKMKPEAKKFEIEAKKLELEVAAVLLAMRTKSREVVLSPNGDIIKATKDLAVYMMAFDVNSKKFIIVPDIEKIIKGLEARIEELKKIQAAIANGTMTEEQWGRYHELRHILLAKEIQEQESEDQQQVLATKRRELMEKREALVAKIAASKINPSSSGTSKAPEGSK